MALKLRTPITFPASVQGDGGIKVTKSNGVWTVEPDFGSLEELIATQVEDPSSKKIWIFDPVTGVYNVLTLTGIGSALFRLTSTTSLAIGTGSKTFVTQQGKAISAGDWVLATSDSDTSQFMLGQITAYTGGALTVDVATVGGSGTYADWTIRLSSPVSSGELSKTDDTNVTATLTGDPSHALLVPVNIAIGWTGQLAVSRGGTGASTSTGSGSVVLSSSPALTDVPTTPTAAVDTNTTQIASTAFVLGQASASGDGTPAMDSTAARGTSTHFARADHVHPSDTSRVPITRTVSTATGLKGGGALSSDRTIDYDIPSLTAKGSPDPNDDYVIIYDAAGTATKKSTVGAISASASSGVTSIGGQTGGIDLGTGLEISGTALTLVTGQPDIRNTGGDGGGVADNATAFNTAADSDYVYVPNGTYDVASNVISDRTFLFDKGAALSGSGKLSARIVKSHWEELYNFKKSNLGIWRKALSSIRYGSLNQKAIACIGDSTTQGSTIDTSVPWYMTKAMQALGINAMNTSVWGTKAIAAITDIASYDSRVGFPDTTSGWSPGSFNSLGGKSFLNSGNTNRLRFTPSVAEAGVNPTTFRMFYFDLSTLGTIRMTLSGGNTQDVSTTGSGDLNVSAIGGATGTTYMDLASTGDGAIHIQGIEAFSGTVNSLLVRNMGVSGFTTANYATSANAWDPLNAFDNAFSELVLFNLGINDWLNSTDRDAFRTSYESLVDAQQTAGGDVIIIVPVPSSTSDATAALQQEFRSVLYGIAYDKNVPLIDLTSRFGSFAIGDAQGLYAASPHPNTLGYGDIGGFLASTLLSA